MIRIALSLLVLFTLFPFTLSYAEPQSSPQKQPTIHDLVDEEYLYAIDFLFFKRLAAGELRLLATDQPNVFRAELIGRTLGVAAWLTGDRTQEYSSLMELTPEGALRSVEYVSRILKRKGGKWKDRGKRYRFDFVQGRVSQEKSRDGVYRPGKVFDLVDEVEPVDILTAFYNLRTGVYGPLMRGTQLQIPTFTSEGVSEILVDILTLEAQKKQKYFPSSGLLFQAKVDPEVFETGGGSLFFWVNDDGIPERGIVEDIIGLGDVRGYLYEEAK